MILIQFSMDDHFIYTVTFDHETHPKHWNPGTMPAKGTVAAPFKPLGHVGESQVHGWRAIACGRLSISPDWEDHSWVSNGLSITALGILPLGWVFQTARKCVCVCVSMNKIVDNNSQYEMINQKSNHDVTFSSCGSSWASSRSSLGNMDPRGHDWCPDESTVIPGRLEIAQTLGQCSQCMPTWPPQWSGSVTI